MSAGPTALAVSGGGTRLYCLNRYEGSVSVLDTESNTVVSTLEAGGSPRAIFLSPDDSMIYVADTIGDRVVAIRTDSGNVMSVPVGDRPEAVAASPDGRFLYCVNFLSQTLSVIDVPALSVVDEVALGNGPSGIAVSPDGRYVYVTNRFDNNVSILASDTLDVLENIEVGKGPTRITVHVASGEGDIEMRSAASR